MAAKVPSEKLTVQTARLRTCWGALVDAQREEEEAAEATSEKKRKQCPLPGIFEEAEDAALYLAATIKDMKAATGGAVVAPPKQNKQHKSRTPTAAPQPAS